MHPCLLTPLIDRANRSEPSHRVWHGPVLRANPHDRHLDLAQSGMRGGGMQVLLVLCSIADIHRQPIIKQYSGGSDELRWMTRTCGLELGELERLPSRRARPDAPPSTLPPRTAPVSPDGLAVDLSDEAEVGVADGIAPFDAEWLSYPPIGGY